jgi:predicted O-methyltransferase YrrM
MNNAVQWNGDTRLAVRGVDFVLAPTPAAIRTARESADRSASLMLFKPRWMVERYRELGTSLQPSNIVELGIYDGGSTALLAMLFQPERLVALDISQRGAPALDSFIEEHRLREHVRPYFGVDQADRRRLEQIVADEFGTAPLDLVIDDASHLLEPSVASFNVLFPRLRPGGLFVIEDWSWEHLSAERIAKALAENPAAVAQLERRMAEEERSAPRMPPLSRLVLELVLTAAYAEEIVAEVTSVRKGWLVLRRGPATLDPDGFDIQSCYGTLGRTMLA